MAIKPGWEGRFFEDFEVGDVYRCRLGRTVTENDNIWFTLLTNNTNQIHFNNEYGKRTEFGKCLINSALTLAILAGMASLWAGMKSNCRILCLRGTLCIRNPRFWKSGNPNPSLSGASSRFGRAASSTR